MSDNPTTISGHDPAAAPMQFRVILDYNPVTGDFGIAGNASDPLIFHGMIGLAVAAFERGRIAKQTDAARRAAASMHLPPGVGPIAIPRRQL